MSIKKVVIPTKKVKYVCEWALKQLQNKGEE